MEVFIMPDKKQYIITSLTLGAIAAVSAAIIGLSNLITRDQIKRNEINKINSGIKEIFGNEATSNEESKIEGDYKYVQSYYLVNSGNEALGFALKTSGSNMYGKISLIIGFEAKNHTFIGLYTVVNEQTYASTLEDNYLIPVNNDEREYSDVSCGATYGAKLVRDMVDEAATAVKEIGK